MILSDRVAGNVSVWGVVTAGLLAIAALPEWSWARQTPDQGAAQATVQPPPTETPAARLQRLEAENRSLREFLQNSLLTEAVSDARGPVEAIVDTYKSEVLALDRGAPDAPVIIQKPGQAPVTRPADAFAPIVLNGVRRIYILTEGSKTTYLIAVDKEGREIWTSPLPARVPLRGDGLKWSFEESLDKTQVILKPSVGSSAQAEFRFDMNTGKLLLAAEMHRPPATDQPSTLQGHALAPSPASSGGSMANAPLVNLPDPEARLQALEKSVRELRQKLEALGRPGSSGPQMPNPGH